jgi:F-type H+-transporting ATPase subunit gamma
VSDTEASLNHKIKSAQDLQGVVRTMKALAASSISQYENSVRALLDYDHTIELGLSACLKAEARFGSREVTTIKPSIQNKAGSANAIVFGSDQGLIGKFNEVIAEYSLSVIKKLPADTRVWAVGIRVQRILLDSGLKNVELFEVPSSVEAIGPLVGKIQIASETLRQTNLSAQVYVFHNRPKPGALYEPVSQRLLPLDRTWRSNLLKIKWPTPMRPEVIRTVDTTLQAFVREYLFISVFRACAESLASENASRLAAMQRADKNIDELLETLKNTSHRLRQGRIDEELFDVVAGFEALERKNRSKRTRNVISNNMEDARNEQS